MSTLFTIHRHPVDAVWLYEQLAFAASGDSILLLEDAVYVAAKGDLMRSFKAKCAAMEIELCVLEDDCRPRAVNVDEDLFKLVDYVGFVELVCRHQRQVAW